MVVYDYIIIGSGIAGIAAAKKLYDKNLLILEKESFPGGDTSTLEIDGHKLNTKVQFGSMFYSSLIESANSLGIEMENFSLRTHIPAEFIEEKERFIEVTKEYKHWWNIISFEKWLEHMKFSESFFEEVLYPYFLVLLMNKETIKGYSAYRCINMLRFFDFLNPENKCLWRFKGGMDTFVKSIISLYSINIKYNKEVKNVLKKGSVIRVDTLTEYFFCKNVIFAVSPIVVSKIYKDITWYQKYIIKWAISMHSDIEVILYRNENSKGSDMFLEYDSATSEGSINLINNNNPENPSEFSLAFSFEKVRVPPSKIVKKIKMKWPQFSSMYEMFMRNININEKNIKFVGAWLIGNLSMECAWISGSF